MSEIKAGDLVMVVRGHECFFRKYSGIVFIVNRIEQPRNGGYTCSKCNMRNAGPNEPSADFNNGFVPVSWLKKIDPPAIPETEERDEEVTA